MDIQTAVENASSFHAINSLVKRATPHVTFWGKRYVTVEGYEGKLDIHRLTVRASEIHHEYTNPPEVVIFQGISCNLISEEKKIYQRKAQKMSDRLVKNFTDVKEIKKHRNFFTKILYQLRIWHSERDGYGTPEFAIERGYTDQHLIFDDLYPHTYKWV